MLSMFVSICREHMWAFVLFWSFTLCSQWHSSLPLVTPFYYYHDLIPLTCILLWSLSCPIYSPHLCCPVSDHRSSVHQHSFSVFSSLGISCTVWYCLAFALRNCMLFMCAYSGSSSSVPRLNYFTPGASWFRSFAGFLLSLSLAPLPHPPHGRTLEHALPGIERKDPFFIHCISLWRNKTVVLFLLKAISGPGLSFRTLQDGLQDNVQDELIWSRRPHQHGSVDWRMPLPSPSVTGSLLILESEGYFLRFCCRCT